jgi:drug/metabolite transporter (DMT)-like permease
VVRLPLAEATLLQYTNPLWAAALAAAVLGERVGRREAAALLAGLAGVGLVVGPGLAQARGAGGLGAGAAAVGLFGRCSAPRRTS